MTVCVSVAGRRVFREYLRLEYSEENMLFWLAVEELKNEQDERRVLEQVRLIYEDFISILSPREVSQRTFTLCSVAFCRLKINEYHVMLCVLFVLFDSDS